MDYETVLFKAKFYFENVPTMLQEIAKNEFMRLRDEAVTIFNDRIDEVNAAWKATGKKASFGKYLEDTNPEYTQFIIDRIQPEIDEKVNSKELFFAVYIGEYGDLYGRLKHIKGSKITLGLKPVK